MKCSSKYKFVSHIQVTYYNILLFPCPSLSLSKMEKYLGFGTLNESELLHRVHQK